MTKDILTGLKPETVFKYFEEISAIPRGSGNEKEISNYLVEFAKKHDLWVKQDEAYNVYIKKPASIGYEEAPTVILQGHMDMVCEKNKDIVHDFEKDGLELIIDGDDIKANGTTLGADDGIALAYQMAILTEKVIKHPAIEVLITTDEERGMTGASHLHPEYLDGKVLINLDTDVEGEFLVSCAGGIRAHMSMDLSYEKIPSEYSTYQMSVSGLLGGHSGADIHCDRANAHLILGRVLNIIRKQMPLFVCHIEGGTKDNVITRECECIFAVPKKEEQSLMDSIKQISDILSKEYALHDADIQIHCIECNQVQKMYSAANTKAFIDLLVLIPNGVISMDKNIENLVETSLNLGVVQIVDNHIQLGSAIRSSVASKKQMLVEKLQILSECLGFSFETVGDYPAWEYCMDSRLREIAGEVFKDIYKEEAVFSAIHAGLECGFLSGKLGELDMIAFGPNVKDIHSPNERASISSMQRVYEYLVTLLAELKNY